MNLALFDLDNTLIAGDSDHLWGEFLVARHIVDGDSFKQSNDQYYRDYLQGTLDINAYLQFALEPLTHFPLPELLELRQEFIAQHILPLKLEQADKLVHKHRAQGDTLVIITATNRFITEPIAELFGVKHLLATEPEIKNNRYTGKITGTPCYQEGKVTRLNQWLDTQIEKPNESYFYTDSCNDIPLLEQVTYPTAVDPDEHLHSHAQKHQWPIISLRESR